MREGAKAVANFSCRRLLLPRLALLLAAWTFLAAGQQAGYGSVFAVVTRHPDILEADPRSPLARSEAEWMANLTNALSITAILQRYSSPSVHHGNTDANRTSASGVLVDLGVPGSATWPAELTSVEALIGVVVAGTHANPGTAFVTRVDSRRAVIALSFSRSTTADLFLDLANFYVGAADVSRTTPTHIAVANPNLIKSLGVTSGQRTAPDIRGADEGMPIAATAVVGVLLFAGGMALAFCVLKRKLMRKQHAINFNDLVRLEREMQDLAVVDDDPKEEETSAARVEPASLI